MTTKSITPLNDAYKAGEIWALSLRPGMLFPGSRVEADAHYAHGSLEARLFSLAAWETLQHMEVYVRESCIVSVTLPDGTIHE